MKNEMDAVLLTAYDEYSVTVLDPQTGRSTRYSMERAIKMFIIKNVKLALFKQRKRFLNFGLQIFDLPGTEFAFVNRDVVKNFQPECGGAVIGNKRHRCFQFRNFLQ